MLNNQALIRFAEAFWADFFARLFRYGAAAFLAFMFFMYALPVETFI